MNKIKVVVILLGVLLTIHAKLYGQKFIGLPKDAIKGMMKTEMPELYFVDNTTNTSYNYLKYVDDLNEQTLLFFLNENNICTMIRYMCDYSLLNKKKKWLNNTYTKTAENQWGYKEGGKAYEIELDEGDWYFTITTRLKKE